MSQTGRFRKKVRKNTVEQHRERHAYNLLAGKVVLGLTLGWLTILPSGLAYADEPQTNITVNGESAPIAGNNGTYDVYAQYVSSDGSLGINRFDKFILGAGDRADMYFNQQGQANYANTLVNMVNSQININGVLNAVKNGKIDGNLYFLSPDGIVVGSQGVINAGSFTGMVVQKDAFNELFEGENNKKKGSGDQAGAEFDIKAVNALPTSGTINVSGHINTHSGILLGASVINVRNGSQLKSLSNIQFEDIVNSDEVPSGLTATSGSGGDIVLNTASAISVDDSTLPELKAKKKTNDKGQETNEYELENWDKWEKGWLNQIFAATNTASINNKGKLVADGAVKLTANAGTTYKEGAIFKYLQDQQIKDLVQTEIRKSIAKDAALQTGLYLFLKATTGDDAADLLKPDQSKWTNWIDKFLLGIMEGTGNRTNTASISLGGEIDAASLEASATANLTMDVDASVMARAYTNVTGKNTADISVNEGLSLHNDNNNIGSVTLAAKANTDIAAAARGLNVERADGDTTTKLPSVYGAVTIVNSESGANVKVDEAISSTDAFKATATMNNSMDVTATSAMNEETGVVSAGVAYVDDKTNANVTINKDITAKSIEASADNLVKRDVLTVNNTLGVMSGQIFNNDTKPVELKSLDEGQKNTINKYLDKLVDLGDGLVGKLKKYGDAGATVGVFNQENNSNVVVNSAMEATGGDIKLNAETSIGDVDESGNPIGGFHMNVVNSMTHAKNSNGSAATDGGLVNAAVLVDSVKNNANVKVSAPNKSLSATSDVNINAKAHMDYAPDAEGKYNVKEAWKKVKESFEAIRDLFSEDIQNTFDGAFADLDTNIEAIDWSKPTEIPSTFANWEKLQTAVKKIKEDGQVAAKTKERLVTLAENAINMTHPSAYTHYHVRTESKNQSTDGSGKFSATGSVQVDELKNNATVLFGEGTIIHAGGDTGIKADSGTYTVSITGKGGEYATLDQNGKVGIGASVAYQDIGGTGLVVVGKNSTIEGNKVDIDADQTMKQVDIVYSSGKADTLNIGGMVNIVKGAGNSIVSIDDETTIKATAADGAIGMHANNDTAINAITGGLTLGGKSANGAVGIGVNWVDYNTNNIVQVADNGNGVAKATDKDTDTDEQKAANRTKNRSILARDLAKELGSVKDDFFGTATADGANIMEWQANSFEAVATTKGTINSIGAEIAGTTSSDKALFDKGSNLIQNISNKRDKFNNWLSGNKLTNTIQGSNASNTSSANVGGNGGFKLSAAGSAAINKGTSDTTATVDSIQLQKNANAALNSVKVQATDSTFLGSFAGGAAFNAMKQNTSPSVAIGGAVADTDVSRTVDSLIMNSQLDGAASITNLAEKTGTEIASGLSLAVNTSGDTNLTASGSVSYDKVHNDVRAMMISTDVNKTAESATKITNKASASDWQIAGGLAANWTGSDGTSANLGGSVSVSDLSNGLVSLISGGTFKQIGNLNMEAAKSINQINVAVAGSKSGGKTAIGLDGAVAFNDVNNNVQTAIRNSAVIDASGAVDLAAHDVEGGQSVSKADLKDKGIDVDYVTDNYISQDAKKTLNNEDVVDYSNDKEIKNTANNNISVPGNNLAINVAAGINFNGNGAGAGVGVDDIKNNLSVDIAGSTLKGSAINANTTNNTKIVGVAAGAAVGADIFGGAGGISWHNVTNNNKVNIVDSNLTANSINGKSDNTSSIVSVAGQFNNSNNVGIGLTLANNDMNNTTGVYVQGGEIKGLTDGKLDSLALDAQNNTYVLAVGAGVGASPGKGSVLSLNGSVAINEGSNSSEAIISKGKQGTKIVNVKDLDVTAENTTSKTTIAGSLTYTQGGIAGIGGGVAYANIGKKDKNEITNALIKDATITTQADSTIDVKAVDSSRAASVGVGVGIEGSVNLQGGVARTNVYKNVTAGMENSSVDEGKNAGQADVNIYAKSTINNKTAGAALATAFSGNIAGAVGLSFNDVNQNTKSFYNYINSRPENFSRMKNLLIDSTADTKLLGIGIGLDASKTFSLGGSYSYNFIGSNTTAEMNKANIISDNNIGVVAQSDDAISNYAGVLAVGMQGGAAGVTVANNQITGDTVSAVDGSKVVTNAAENGDDTKKISVNSGMKDSAKGGSDGILSGMVSQSTFDPSKLKAGRENSTLTGLVVDSSATHAIASDALTGAGGAIGGVSGTFNEDFVTGATKAQLNNASVNEDAAQYGGSVKDAQNISVKAADYTNIGTFEVGVSGGQNLAAAAAQNTNSLDRTALAESNYTTAKAHDFDLQALSRQGIANLAIAGGLVIEGVDVNANVINDDITMKVETKADHLALDYTNKANLQADNESRAYMGTFEVSGAATGAAIGLGINLVDQKSTVSTTVSNSTLKETTKTDSAANITAKNKTVLDAALVSGGVAGLGGSLSGTFNYSDLTSDVGVSINKSTIQAGKINVNAHDVIWSTQNTGTTQGGLFGGFGVNSTVNTIADKSHVAISNNSNLKSQDNTSVNADIVRDLDSFMLNVSLGGVASGVNHLETSINEGIKTDNALLDKIKAANSQDKDNTKAFVGMTTAERQQVRERTAFNIDTDVSETDLGSKVSINSSTIESAGVLSLTAEEKNRADLQTIGADVGGLDFVITQADAKVKNATAVDLDGATLSGSIVDIAAKTADNPRENDDDKHKGIYTQGAVGNLGALGITAISSTADMSGSTGINVKNTNIAAANNVNIIADNDVTANTNVVGVSAGVVSVNVIDEGINNTSAVAVNFEASGAEHTIKSTNVDGMINVSSVKTGNFTANSTGISAGLAAAGYNETYTKDNSTSQINIKGGNYAFNADTLSFLASNAPKLKVDIDNDAVGVVTGMASKATVEANSGATINVADNNVFSAGSVLFGAKVGNSDETTATSRLRSVAVAGMSIPGYSGDESNITTKTNVAINIGNEDYSYTVTEKDEKGEDKQVEKYGALTIDARNEVSRKNDISNVTVSALKFAAGAIEGNTRAEDMVSATAGGGKVFKLMLGATGNSYTDSYVRASGGGIADYGNTGKANTYFDNSANANIYGVWSATEDLHVNAKQSDGMDVQASSGSGSLLQGSGVYTDLNIGDKNRVTSANVANNAVIVADKVYVGAQNELNTRLKNTYGSRLDMTAGNFLGMSVLESKDVIKKATQVNIGDNASVVTTGTQTYEATNKDLLTNYATGLNAGLAESIVVQSRTDYTSNNKVYLGKGAFLKNTGGYDKGGITLASSDNINSTVHAEGKVSGGAGAGPTAKTEHNINRTNLVDVNGFIRSDKDINLYAGADGTGQKSTVRQLTIADARNDTVIPLGWHRDIDIENKRNNTVLVHENATGKAMRNINIKAINGEENLLKRAAYHTFYTGSGGDGQNVPVVESSSSDGSNVDKMVSKTTNYAQVDGDLLAGFQDKVYVTISGQVVPESYLGYHEAKATNDKDVIEKHNVTATGNDKAFTISIVDDEGKHYADLEQKTIQNTQSYANMLTTRWVELKRLMADYNGKDTKGGDGNTLVAYAGYMQELELLEAKMKKLGLMVEETTTNGNKVWIPITTGYDIPVVTLPELLEACGGTVNVDSNNFYGKGSVVAKTNPEIIVKNTSNAYLLVNDVLVHDKGDGVIFKDNIIDSDAAGKEQIKNLNADKNYDVSYSKLKSIYGDEPMISIISDNASISGISLTDNVTYMSDGHTATLKKNYDGIGTIEIAGHVDGGIADVEIVNTNSSGGDIIIDGTDKDNKVTGVDGHSIRLSSKSGSVTQSYTQGIVHIGSTPEDVYEDINQAAINSISDSWGLKDKDKHETKTIDGSSAFNESVTKAGKAGRIAGNTIFIAADAINVNGILQSGYGNYKAVVTQEQVEAAKTAANNHDFSKSKLYEGRRIYKVNEGGSNWDAEKASDGSLVYNVQVYYDPDNDTLLTENIDAQGGKVYLTGRIISTTGGQIFAVDGAADISIDNQSNVDMQVGKILNNDINGEVVLTTSSLKDGKEYLTRSNYTTKGITITEGYLSNEPRVTTDNSNAGRSYTFNPVANSRYNWTRGTDSTSNVHYYYRDTAVLDWDALEFESASDKAEKTETEKRTIDLQKGRFISTEAWDDYNMVADNVVLSQQKMNYEKSSKNYVLWKNYYYNWDVKTGASQTYVSSIKADKPIEIRFIGQDNGTINIKGNGNISLTGNISNNNAQGTISIDSAGDIIGNSGASIIGNKVSLKAKDDIDKFNIDALDRNKTVELGAETNRGNININVTGDAEITTIKAHNAIASLAGDNNITLNVSGNITQGTGDGVKGQRIELTSKTGAIGTSEQGLKVITGQQALNDDSRSASISATAQKDIFLTNGPGGDNDMRIGIVRSITGDVTLTNEGGSFVDALPYTGDETSDETAARVQRWIDSGMIAGPNRNNAYIRKLERDVANYKEVIENNFTNYLTMKKKADSHMEMSAKEQDTYNTLKGQFGKFSTSDAYLAQDSTYAKLQAEAANPTYKWTQDELLYALRSEILNKEVGSTDSRDKIANVSGRNITLKGENVGSNLVPQNITVDQLRNGYSEGGKTNVDYLKILANADSSDVVRLEDSNGKEYFQVTGTAPLGINATGVVNAITVGNDREDISLSARKATEDGEAPILKIGTLQADKGYVRVLGKIGLENVLDDPTAANVIAGTEVLLEGGEGTIGTDAKPINVKAGGDLTARSNGNIFIKNVGENPLSIGSVYTPDTLKLFAGNGLVGSTVNIDGIVPYINVKNLILDGSGSNNSMGTAARPLNVLSNGVNVEAKGDSANIRGIQHDKNSIILNNIDMDTDFAVNTPGTVIVTDVVKAGNDIELTGNKGVKMSKKEAEDEAASYVIAGNTISLNAKEGDVGDEDNAIRVINNGAKVGGSGVNGYLVGLERPELNTVATMTIGSIGTTTVPGFTGNLWIKSPTNLSATDVINVKGDIVTDVNNDITSQGDWIAGGNININGVKNISAHNSKFTAGKDVNLIADHLVETEGDIKAGNNVNIISERVKIEGDVTADNNALLRSYNGDIHVFGNVTAQNDVFIPTKNGKVLVGGGIKAINGDVYLSADYDDVSTDKRGSIAITEGIYAGKDIRLDSNNSNITILDWQPQHQSVVYDDVITAGRNVFINTFDKGDINLLGSVKAGGNVQVLAAGNEGNIDIYNTINADGSVNLQAFSDNGTVHIGYGTFIQEPDGPQYTAPENQEVHAGNDLNISSNNGEILIAKTLHTDEGDIKVTSTGAPISILGKAKASEGSIDFATGTGYIAIGDTLDHNEESISAKKDITLSTDLGTIYIYGKTVTEEGDINLKAGKNTYEPGKSNFVIEDNGAVVSGKDISLTGRNGDIFIADYLKAQGGVKATVINQGSVEFATDITVNGNVELSTDKGDVTVGKNVVSKNGNIDIDTNDGNITIDQNLYAKQGSISAVSGHGEIKVGNQGPDVDAVAAKTDILLEAQDGKLTVHGRTRSTDGDITLSAKVPEYQKGKGSIIIEQEGQVVSGGNINVNSGNGDFHITDRVQAADNLNANVIGKGSMYYDTDIDVKGDVAAKVDEGDIHIGASINSGGNVDLAIGEGNINVGHSVTSTTGDINLKVGKGNIDVGDNDGDTETITANQNVNIEATLGKITVYGMTSTENGDIKLTAGSESYVAGDNGMNIIIDHNGRVDSARNVNLTTTNGDLHVTDNVNARKNIGAKVNTEGSLYFDRDIEVDGDLEANTEKGNISARNMRAKGDIRISQQAGDLLLNLAEAENVSIHMGENTELSHVNTIRANANNDDVTDIDLAGKFIKIGTMENKSGTSPLLVSFEAPDGQTFVEKLTVDKISSNTGTKVLKLWTNNGYANVDNGVIDIDDTLVGDKFNLTNKSMDVAIYGRTPTHDGEVLVYWNNVNNLYPMGRQFKLFEDGGILTNNAHLVEYHDWRLFRSNKYPEQYSVVDMMRDNLMRKYHYYNFKPLIPYDPKVVYGQVETEGEIVNSIKTKNADEQEIILE
ncbi:MAG: hypothetical protein E7197_07085 [Anaerovibrio sp.]|uniref:hypothetical protein n=1 Tax=Anaerovibrio sp. TaxID=1872532 RepID=UPI0025C2FBC4|nr:hypothetical protein [Anaerovibrio sp.]MBE6099805.1 hypothetical protein [Anaerovibrio sp.]